MLLVKDVRYTTNLKLYLNQFEPIYFLGRMTDGTGMERRTDDLRRMDGWRFLGEVFLWPREAVDGSRLKVWGK